MTLVEEKKLLRTEIKNRISNLSAEYVRESDKAIVQNMLQHPWYQEANMIFCFVGTEKEIHTKLFLEQAFADHKRVCVPLCVAKGVMEPREIGSLSELVQQGHYGILEPANNSRRVLTDEIDLAILPCVTYNKKGERLGHGGGYYDRFLEKAGFRSILICREQLLSEQIPMEEHDIRIPAVITELGCFSTME
ncbi:5-formyltetrahydrofolate cyclo-ligase [Clostridium minihomine]|uniref:5-formyltetrahydrofolate cyclo-ligase n=1 Tax=Clostridium minihomine TaxID=2045012 RepID=UPI000C778BCA|nr:5-formyltetrahydrofolate cyclo-ligase [Clostridium minihomine]